MGSLIVFSGPACSGKTLLAARLAESLATPHLQMDATRARLMPDSPHTRHDRQIAYRAMHFAAELLLGCRRTMILDAPYGHLEDRHEVEEVVARTHARLYLIECNVTPEIAASRFRDRPADHPGLDLTEERVFEMAHTFPYSGVGLTIDTAVLSVEEASRAIAEYVASERVLRLGVWSAALRTAGSVAEA